MSLNHNTQESDFYWTRWQRISLEIGEKELQGKNIKKK